jgi:hypothetical protein
MFFEVKTDHQTKSFLKSDVIALTLKMKKSWFFDCSLFAVVREVSVFVLLSCLIPEN